MKHTHTVYNALGYGFLEKVYENALAHESIIPRHGAQLLNYLKATDVEVGLLLNFGPEPKFQRKILTKDRKKRKTNG